MFIVGLVALVVALDSSVSRRLRKFLHALEVSPTAVLKSSVYNETETYWHEVTAVNNVTSLLDRIMLRRRIEVEHRRLQIWDDTGLTADPTHAQTNAIIDLFEERKNTGYYTGTSRLVPVLKIPEDAVYAR